jgi:uncharacterized protein
MTYQDLGITQKSFELILKTLKSFPQIDEAIIFGSRAIGNFKKGSDIDLVLKGEKVTTRLIFQISAILNERLPIPYFVDILLLSQIINPDLINHINRAGKVIYSRNLIPDEN